MSGHRAAIPLGLSYDELAVVCKIVKFAHRHNGTRKEDFVAAIGSTMLTLGEIEALLARLVRNRVLACDPVRREVYYLDEASLEFISLNPARFKPPKSAQHLSRAGIVSVEAGLLDAIKANVATLQRNIKKAEAQGNTVRFYITHAGPKSALYLTITQKPLLIHEETAR